jgi:hypothetical protein
MQAQSTRTNDRETALPPGCRADQAGLSRRIANVSALANATQAM